MSAQQVFARDLKGTCSQHTSVSNGCEACFWAARARGVGNLCDAYLALAKEQSGAISAFIAGDQLEALNAVKRASNVATWAQTAIAELTRLG
jgi:hypothetical protein